MKIFVKCVRCQFLLYAKHCSICVQFVHTFEFERRLLSEPIVIYLANKLIFLCCICVLQILIYILYCTIQQCFTMHYKMFQKFDIN